MPFKRHKSTDDHLPASQREDTETESDVEGHAARGRARQSEDYLPPAEPAANDDGSDDVEGQGFKSGR